MIARDRPAHPARPGYWGPGLFALLFAVYVAGGFYVGIGALAQIAGEPSVAGAAPGAAPDLPPYTGAAMPPTPVARATPGGLPMPGGAPPPQAVAPTPTSPADTPPVAVQDVQRRNFLLMGLDQREDSADWDPGRTDTMIVASIDPAERSVTLLSIPRDLWVDIPSIRSGKFREKITGAHTVGALQGYPTGDDPYGGPKLAAATVQYNLGIPIHYWARVDLNGFEKAVDLLGGVWVDVEEAVVDDEYPTDDYGYMSIYIPAGRHLLDGRTALQFARSRHSGNDLERGTRQRQVLMGARQQALSLNMIARLPEMLDIFQDHFATNMSVAEMTQIANYLRTIPPGNVRSKAIDYRYVRTFVTETGAQALELLRDRVSELIFEVFYRDTAVQGEGTRVIVRNGAGREGLAAIWAGKLRGLGYIVVQVDTADRIDYAETVIIDRTPSRPKTASIARLRAEFGGLPASRVQRASAASDGVDADIEIILGQDTPDR